MNFNDLQNTWNSPLNHLPTDQQRELAERFARQMNRRRRFQATWLSTTFTMLTVTTGITIHTLALGKVNTTQEWAVIPLLLIPWAFAFVFLFRFFKPLNPARSGEVPVVESLTRALASNRSSQTHLKLVGLLYLIFIPVLALVMSQLHAVGKVSDRELVSMGTALGVALLISGGLVALRYFAALIPQARTLNRLIAELTGENPGK